MIGLTYEDLLQAFKNITAKKAPEKKLNVEMQMQLEAMKQQTYSVGNAVSAKALGYLSASSDSDTEILSSAFSRFSQRSLTRQDLTHEAFNAAIAVLCDLWLAKFGYAWVEDTQLIADDFFFVAAKRLALFNKLEQHELSGGVKVHRLVNEV